MSTRSDNEGLAEVIVNTILKCPEAELQMYFTDPNDGPHDEYLLHRGDAVIPIGQNLIRFKYTEQISETKTVQHDVVLHMRDFESMEVCE